MHFPASESSWRRHVSEPSPDSEGIEERTTSFKRQVSEPAPEAANVRRDSAFHLMMSLHGEAIGENKQPPWALIAGIVFFNVVGKIGDAVGPAMVGSMPIQLLVLNASNTHCILTTTSVPFLLWVVLGVGRRFCEDPMYFYAGWRYREACLGMLRNWSSDMADSFDKAENMFRNNLYLAVALNPGATVCALAGASRMAPITFFALNVGSTTGQLLIMRYICLMFPDRIDEALDMISKYMMILLAVMVGITLFGCLPMLRKKEHAE